MGEHASRFAAKQKRAASCNRLERHYQLAFSVSDGEAALAIAERLLTDPATPAIWRGCSARHARPARVATEPMWWL